MLTFEDGTPQEERPEHRSAELTRPLRLSHTAIVAAITVTAAMLGILGLGIGRDSLGLSSDVPTARVELSVSNPGGSGVALLGRQIAITPDGDGIVFVMVTEEGDNALAYHALDGESPVIIEGSETVLSPEISSDGRYVTGNATDGATATRRVRVSMRGGELSPAVERTDPRVTALEEDGARVQQIIDRDRKALIVRATPGGEAGPASIRTFRTGSETPLVDDEVVEMRYGAGHLVYARPDGSLWAAPFDSKRGRITAKPVKIAANVSLTGTGIAQFAVSRNGNVAYLPEAPRSLVLVTRAGQLRGATPEKRGYSNPRFSPDGKRIAVDFTAPDGRDVWTVSVDSATLKRATFEGDAHDAVWTPDGKFITFTSFRRGALGIYRSRPGMRAAPDSLFTGQQLVYSGEWLKDGSGLVTTATDLAPRSRLDLAFVANKGRGPISSVLVDPAQTRFPGVSPDARWLAYVSNESGRDEVYVRRWNAEGASTRVSTGGGTEPVWGLDGKDLFYRDTPSQYLVAASTRADSTLTVERRRSLFPIADMRAGVSHSNYDISPDGRYFVMVRSSGAGEITVLRNLPAFLRAAGSSRDAASPE